MRDDLIDPATIDEHSIIKPGRRVGTIAVDDRVVLVDESAGRAYCLNPTGSIVWECLDGVSPLGHVIDDLNAVFDGQRQQIEGDVANLVKSFASLGLLENVGRPIHTLPIEVEMVGPEGCEPDAIEVERDEPVLERYLAVPPNH